MKFPDFIYTPSDYDSAKQIVLPQRVAQRRTFSSLTTTIVNDVGPVPRDQVLVVTAAAVEAQAGAAQTVTGIRIVQSELDAAGAQVEVCILQRGFFTTQFNALVFVGEAMIMPGEFVRLVATYSAAGVNNNAETSLMGYLIPRANVQHTRLPSAP